MILVTGSKGLVGSHLMERLKCVGVDLPEYDLTKLSDVNDIFYDYDQEYTIIHCAAMSHIPETIKKPYRAFEANVTATVNLLEVARRRKIKHFIYLSSVSTYGDFGNWLVNEAFPLRPKGIYETTKASSDFIVQAYNKIYDLPTTVIRTSSVYGIGDKHPRLVRNFIDNAQSGKPIVIRGNGNLRRDFTYVKDLVEGILLCLDNPKAKGEVFNITGGKEYSINDLAMLVCKLIPGTQIKYEDARAFDINRGELDLMKAKSVLGYFPKYTLEQGIKEIINERKNTVS